MIDDDGARLLWKMIFKDCVQGRPVPPTHGPSDADRPSPPPALAPPRRAEPPLPPNGPAKPPAATGPDPADTAAEAAAKCPGDRPDENAAKPKTSLTVPYVPPTVTVEQTPHAGSMTPADTAMVKAATAAQPTAGEVAPPEPPVAPEKPTGAGEAAVAPQQPPEVAEPPKKKPEWKVLEPEDRADPVPHEACDLVERNDQWTILAASVRGKLHAHKGLWRDDAYAFGWVDDWTIIVVSDGAGSAKLSRIGAQIACRESLEELKQLLAGWKLSPGKDGQLDQNELRRLRTFLVSAAAKAIKGVQREAQSRDCPVKTMNATLLLMVHVPVGQHDLVGAIQVGDGAVGIYCEDGSCTLMGIADHGEYSSETRFLTTPNIEREFEQRVLFSIKRGVRCLAAMCDGVSDDFFPEDKRLVELFVGDPITGVQGKDGRTVRGVLHEVVRDPREGKALLEWLGYERRASSDDRTLVLMYRSPR
jgi:serine/threonine protein phosphatase PrpC